MPLNWAIIVAPNLLQEKLHRRNERAVWSEEEEEEERKGGTSARSG